MDKYTGKKLDGRYEIGELIGVGGMAYVYHCYDTIDDREVSIKILKDEFLHNADFIRRFKNESKAIAVLSHPNIVKIYDVSFGDMIQYIVMEYIEGVTLKEYISQQGAIDWRESVHYVSQVLKALQHAHTHGIVHRDIKPQNIMLLSDGSIKVTDFGIARFSDNSTRTMTDQAIGSVHYIAPEQARGSTTDGKSDIYSLGVMLYEMLTGKLPFEAENAVSVAIMQLQSTPKKPSEINSAIPAGLEDIILKAMQKNTAARYQSAAEMLRDLEQLRADPHIRFSYNCFVDDEPTKYVDDLGAKKQPKKDYSDYNDNFGYSGSNSSSRSSSRSNSNSRRGKELDDEMFADDKPKKKKNKAVFAIAGVVLALVLIGIVIGVHSLLSRLESQNVEDVDVPSFIGMTLDEIRANNPYNFVFQTEIKYDESKEIGVVLDQDPKANSKKIKEGATITLTINGTEEEIPVPNLTGSTAEDARAALTALNLIPEILEIENEDYAQGYVIRTAPAANSTVSVGDTVYIYVSMGATKGEIVVPDVRNYTYEDAVRKLRSEGLLAKTTYDQNSELPKDTVVTQNPLPNSVVEEGYVVELVLSSGKPIEKEVPIYVELPVEESNTVALRVLIDGVVDPENSKEVVPKYNGTYTVKLKGTGKAHIVVELNGAPYREYDVNFSTQNVSTTKSYPYVVQQEKPTEPDTPVDPASDPATEE